MTSHKAGERITADGLPRGRLRDDVRKGTEMALETIRFDIQDFLKTADERAGFLEAVFEDGDPEIAVALDDVREAIRRENKRKEGRATNGA